MTRADIGLADAYIDADFSFVDKNEGLLNLVQVIIVFVFRNDHNHFCFFVYL